MSLCNRYDNPGAGVRLDNETAPGEGIALDLGKGKQGAGSGYSLWIRDEDDRAASIPVSLVDLENLRDGISRILVHEGVNIEIRVTIPVPG